MLTFTESLIKCDGVLYVRYTPVFDAGIQSICAVGKLQFAAWDVAVGEPLTVHQEAKDKARKNAVDVLLRIAASL